MRRVLITVILLSATNALAVEPSVENSRAVDRARETLSKKLEEAKADGVIVIKGDPDNSSDEEKKSPEPSKTPVLAQPANLRDGYETASDCLTPSRLAAAGADDPFGRIEQLLIGEEGETKADRYWKDARLAETYLAIGFFDEAYALSSKTTGPRSGAISIFASTALGPNVTIPKEPLNADQCGELHSLATKISHAYEADGLEFDAEDLKLIGSLPSPVAQSVFDFISVAAIDQNKLDLAARIREARAAVEGVVQKTQAGAYADAALLLAERPDAASAETLLSLTADPGPLRERALQNLVTGNAAALLDESKKTALYANLEDAHAAAAEGDWKVALGDALIDHDMKKGDWKSALDLLRRKLDSHGGTDLEAVQTFTHVLSEKLLGENKDDALSALAFVAENAEISAKTLGAEAFKATTETLVQLGAAEVLEDLLEFRGSGASDNVRIRAEAKLRSGDTDGLKQLVSGREGEAELLEIIAKGSLQDPASAVPHLSAEIASSPKAVKTVAWTAWAKGDWKKAASLFRSANDLSPQKELSEHASLAYLASGAAEDANAHGRSKADETRDPALARFFLAPPSVEYEDALREFSNGIALEVDFIRKRKKS